MTELKTENEHCTIIYLALIIPIVFTRAYCKAKLKLNTRRFSLCKRPSKWYFKETLKI